MNQVLATIGATFFIFMAGFMGGYIYRDNTIVRTLEVHIDWPGLEVTPADEIVRKEFKKQNAGSPK